jgi:hypothetical protein
MTFFLLSCILTHPHGVGEYTELREAGNEVEEEEERGGESRQWLREKIDTHPHTQAHKTCDTNINERSDFLSQPVNPPPLSLAHTLSHTQVALVQGRTKLSPVARLSNRILVLVQKKTVMLKKKVIAARNLKIGPSLPLKNDGK